MLPVEFTIAGKRNLTLKAYPRYDHQFFELKKNSSGGVVGKIYQGDKVAAEWMKWMEK
ncbi:hypothetical protein [Dyadobacter luteus]|nr:hypothetical protein [Dyadobacter luteus]